MKYRELLKQLQNLPDERLDDDATIHLTGIDEYYEIGWTREQEETDVLDKGHFVLMVQDGNTW